MSTFERPGSTEQISSDFDAQRGFDAQRSDSLHGDVGELLAIDTPEQIDLHFSVAGIGSRFVALLLDWLLIGAAGLVVGLVSLFIFGVLGASHKLQSFGPWLAGILLLILFLFTWCYFALFEAYWTGQTPGKRVMKLRVIKDTGRQITLFEALARNLLRYVDYLPGLYLAGVITMLCNKRHKRLGDYVAGTLVVHERTEEQPLLFQSSMNFSQPADAWRQQTPAMFPADAVAKLNGQDLLVIETFFSRMLDLQLETRAAIAYRIARQMGAKMGVAMPEGNPERALESIAYQMRSRN